MMLATPIVSIFKKIIGREILLFSKTNSTGTDRCIPANVLA